MVGIARRYHEGDWRHIAVIKSIEGWKTVGGRQVPVAGSIIIEAQGWDDASQDRPDGTTPHSSLEKVFQHDLIAEYPPGDDSQKHLWRFAYSMFDNN